MGGGIREQVRGLEFGDCFPHAHAHAHAHAHTYRHTGRQTRQGDRLSRAGLVLNGVAGDGQLSVDELVQHLPASCEAAREAERAGERRRAECGVRRAAEGREVKSIEVMSAC